MDDFSCPERTWLCSILFLDIVDFSSQSQELQMEWKVRLNHFVHEILDGLPEQERFILDTGDGAVVCFLGGPDAVMDPALKIRRHFVETEPKLPSPMNIRMGINLGPVQLVKDINDRLNALGDGINVGQRVMSFATDNQILVSRSFYEVVSRLSASYEAMFSFVGSRKDKHGREHFVYQLAPPGAGVTPPGGSTTAAPSASTEQPVPFDAAALACIEALLVPVLGPISGRVIKDICHKHSNLEDLCSELATNLAGNEERTKFLEQCREQFAREVAHASNIPAKSIPVPGQASGVVWDPAMLEKAKLELAVYIGPMAKFIVDSTASQVHTVKDFYDALCREIPSTQDRERFLSSCKSDG
jgi:hypothetical protein